MGTCNCSNNQLEKLSQVDFDRMENIDEENSNEGNNKYILSNDKNYFNN